jgi:hypothetical protein
MVTQEEVIQVAMHRHHVVWGDLSNADVDLAAAIATAKQAAGPSACLLLDGAEVVLSSSRGGPELGRWTVTTPETAAVLRDWLNKPAPAPRSW